MRKLFVASLLGVSVTVLGSFSASVLSYIQLAEQQKLITEYERDSFIIASRVQPGLASNDLPESLTALVTSYAAENVSKVVILDATGTSVISSDEAELGLGEDFTTRPEVASALNGNVATGERWSDTAQDQLVYVAVPIVNGNTIYGAVRLTFSHSQIDAAVAQGTQFVWWIAGGAITLSLVLSWYISGLVIRPLKMIESQANAMGSGDFSSRIPERRWAKEIRTLVQAFNGMADRIESLMRQQRAFASDASHQLRTPLTALLLRLERARELVSTDPVTAKQRLHLAEEEVHRLNNIVEGLLVIARAEGGSVETGLVELVTLATDRIEAWQPLCDERNVTMSLDVRGSVVCSAVLTGPEQVLDNYIDNALTHSPDGSRILVKVFSEGERAVLEVWDEGAGLSIEDCERAFDRFWRADSTREGSGLGLAIVKHLVETTGGVADLRPRRDGRSGTIARATFPIVVG